MENYQKHTGQYFEVTVKGLVEDENGNLKKTKWTAAVFADTFSMAEKKATDTFAQFFKDGFEVAKIARAKYDEVWEDTNNENGKFFICRLSIITMDETSGKEKRSKMAFLVQAETVKAAQHCIDDVVMKSMMQDYETCAISLSAVTEFF